MSVCRALVIALLLWAVAACGRKPSVPEEARELLAGHRVVLLSATWCGYCDRLRADFQRAGVSFQEWDVEHTDTGAALRDSLGGGLTVPVTIIGDDVLYGYQPEQILARARAAD